MKTEEKIQELEKQIEFLKKEYKQHEVEQWFKSLLNGLKIEIDENYPNSTFYKKDEIGIFELYQCLPNKRYLWCDYELVWSILENKYGFNNNEIKLFINDMIGQYLKLDGVIPIWFKMFPIYCSRKVFKIFIAKLIR
jgi:hypothetical protein